MDIEQRVLDPEAAAEATRMELSILRQYAELGLIIPSSEGYAGDDLAELRRVRRLREDLELDHPAIEIILRIRRRIQALQTEIRRLEAVAAARRLSTRESTVEAEWDDLF